MNVIGQASNIVEEERYGKLKIRGRCEAWDRNNLENKLSLIFPIIAAINDARGELAFLVRDKEEGNRFSYGKAEGGWMSCDQKKYSTADRQKKATNLLIEARRCVKSYEGMEGISEENRNVMLKKITSVVKDLNSIGSGIKRSLKEMEDGYTSLIIKDSSRKSARVS